jgi:signal peptidase II
MPKTTRTTKTQARAEPSSPTFARIAIALGLAGAADLLSKRAVVAAFVPGQRRELIAPLLAVRYVRNERGAMGLFGDHSALLVSLALLVLIGLAIVLRTSIRASSYAQVGYGLVAGGALGNVVDRAIHGYVVDFISIPYFWIFNVGDACITCGLVLLAVPAFRTHDGT